MEKIDAAWIKARLTGEHGEKKRLADAMGIAETKLSKILSGERLIKAAEVPAVMAFFATQKPKSARLQSMLERIERLSGEGQAQAEVLIDVLLAREAALKEDQD